MQQLKTIKKQVGMTMISWMVVLGFLGFQGVLAMKIAPVYFNDASIEALFKEMEDDSEMRGKKPRELRKIVVKRLKINNIYNIKKDQIKITKAKGHYRIRLEYETREKIAGSLSFVMDFKHEANISSSR